MRDLYGLCWVQCHLLCNCQIECINFGWRTSWILALDGYFKSKLMRNRVKTERFWVHLMKIYEFQGEFPSEANWYCTISHLIVLKTKKTVNIEYSHREHKKKQCKLHKTEMNKSINATLYCTHMHKWFEHTPVSSERIRLKCCK